jgi:hypothetical protein
MFRAQAARAFILPLELAAAFFSASGGAFSQEVPTVKRMPNQPAL